MKLQKSRWIGICSALLCVILIISFGLHIDALMPQRSLKLQEVTVVAFLGGENGDRVFYEFSKDSALEFATVVKNADLKGLPTKNFGEIKGGAPLYITRIETSESKHFDISYLRLPDKNFLVINGLGFECDEQTIEKISEIIHEQMKLM